jgi:ferrochelatase
MRYWHPFASEVIDKLSKFNPSEVILLPLYPQASSATTLSSFEEFEEILKKSPNLKEVKVKKIGCYFDDAGFIETHINLIKTSLHELSQSKKIRILFSAHSIPKKFVESGDPYEWQINKTYQAIIQDEEIAKYDTRLCYQSKLGPIEWLSPSTEKEIESAAKEKIDLLVVPVAFVSEHIETLVELDIEYKEIAHRHGIKYVRVKALGEDQKYIESLGDYVINAHKSKEEIICFRSEICPKKFNNCLCRAK